jgi:hypothetical protein
MSIHTMPVTLGQELSPLDSGTPTVDGVGVPARLEATSTHQSLRDTLRTAPGGSASNTTVVAVNVAA